MTNFFTENADSGKTFFSSFAFKGQKFAINECVYLMPNTYKFAAREGPKPKVIEPKDVSDAKTYPEAYRKNKYVKGSNDNCPDPFLVARIIAIYAKDGVNGKAEQKSLKLKIGKFYRPEDTHRGVTAGYQSNFNVLFWCDEETVSMT